MTGTVDLNGLFKEVYADEITNLIPDTAVLTKEIPFTAANQKLGSKYNLPVIVGAEQGITFAGPDAGAFALNAPISMKMKNATVNGYQHMLSAQIDVESITRSGSGKAAFKQAMNGQVESIVSSLTSYVELDMLYGQNTSGLGIITSTAAGDATHCVFTFAAGQWSTGIWAGREGAALELRKVSDNTKVNVNGPVYVSAVDSDAKTLTVVGLAADITLLVAMAANDMFVTFYGNYGNCMAGIDKIITNTGSLFNIDAATYNLWKGSSYAVGGALTFDAVQAAVTKAVERGGLNESVKVYINPKAWVSLLSPEATRRSYDASYSNTKVKTGSQEIEFYGQSGVMSIVAHPLVKEGEGFVLPTKRIKRIGSSDIAFQSELGKVGQYLWHLPSNAGLGYRAYSNQAIIAETPAKLVKLVGIVTA